MTEPDPTALAPVAPASEVAELIRTVTQLARDTSVDISRAREVWAFKKEIEAEIAKYAFDELMAKAQGEIEPVTRNKKNDQTGKMYADLAAVHEAATPIVTKYGFATSFAMGETTKPQHYRVICRTSNKGHTQVDWADFPFDEAGFKGSANKTPLHGMKSVITYAQRVLFCMVWNIATEDDDGNKGGGKPVTSISDEQAETLTKMLASIGRTPDQFAAWFAKAAKLKSSALADIPAALFATAKGEIENLIAAKVEKKTKEMGDVAS